MRWKCETENWHSLSRHSEKPRIIWLQSICRIDVRVSDTIIASLWKGDDFLVSLCLKQGATWWCVSLFQVHWNKHANNVDVLHRESVYRSCPKNTHIRDRRQIWLVHSGQIADRLLHRWACLSMPTTGRSTKQSHKNEVSRKGISKQSSEFLVLARLRVAYHGQDSAKGSDWAWLMMDRKSCLRNNALLTQL